jgi:hypothetical protein
VHEMLDSETGETAATCEMTAIHMDRIFQKSARFLRRSVKRPYSTSWRPNRRPNNHDLSMTSGESR